MAIRLRVSISGHADADLHLLASALKKLPDVDIQARLLGASDVDPLGEDMPDVLIHHLGEQAERELTPLMHRPARLRPVLLIVGSAAGDDPRIMRLAMQAGARDFIARPVVVEEVTAEIRKIAREKLTHIVENNALTAFVGPKGGAGASSLAGGVAHALATRIELPTLLLDLDLQFGSQYLNLDLHPEKGLKEALDAVDTLDEVALTGYVTQHASGLHVLGALPSQILLPGELSEQRMERLLGLLRQNYNQVVVDLPCLIDPIFGLITEKMRHAVIVVQQDFQNIRSGQKLIRILTDELQVPAERIGIVINRYDPKHSISHEDIELALQTAPLAIIPSDFKAVNGAANLGLPILAHAPQSPVAAGIVDLAEWVGGRQKPAAAKKTFFEKIRSSFSSRK